ncbi:MAG TPA: hypothetical protein VGD69_22880 [Herpetosiphonaceae bacterium]
MASGQLTKAEIENLDTGKSVVCMFNPKEYTLSRSNNWTDKTSKGRDVPELEFGGGAPANLTLQLLFDTYETRGDVSKITQKLWEMMKIVQSRTNPATKIGEPPHCQFKWGSVWAFEAVIVSISQKFTLFAADGTPLRAILDVTFKQIADQDKYPRQNPTSGGNPGEHVRMIREGETLPYIAYEEYGDSTVWRHLADTNSIRDPRRLRPGDMLLITPLQ